VNCILLLGAGFSRNWGGRLATEVRAELQSVLRTDQYLARLVQQRDFETALSIVQGEYDQRQSPQSCYKAGKSANIHASSGVIRGIPVLNEPSTISSADTSRFGTSKPG